MSHSSPPPKAIALPIPDLQIDGHQVRNLAAGDIYFSAENGLAESAHVFLSGNYLPRRFMGRLRFSIGEIGFGTGLNFLASWRAFDENVIEPDARLFYVSTEHSPLSESQLSEALALFPELKPYADALTGRYPIRVPGWHRIAFDRVVLWLGFGDAANLLSEFHGKIDAWYLDGFAPVKNPEAWDDTIFKQIDRLSQPDATLATFSVAASVRNACSNHGFSIEKIEGYGQKRHMLRAVRKAGRREALQFAVPQVAVIGGGIAGASAAHSLALRGAQVSLFESNTLASAASGNPSAVLFPRIAKQFDVNVQASFLGYAHILREITALGGWCEETGFAKQTGMLKYPKSLEERAKLYGLQEALGLDGSIARWVTYEEASALTGLDLSDGGVWYPHGTMLDPAALIAAYTAHERIRVNAHCQVEDVTPYGEGYLITLEDAACAATDIVLANAAGALNYHISEHLPLRLSAGQLSLLPKSETTGALKSIFCHLGYTVPCAGEDYVIGATYDHDNLSLELTAENHQHNLSNLMFYAPGFVHGKPVLTQGRASHRVAVPGHVPLTGRLMGADGNAVSRAYISMAHASRGMISAPLAGEKIAAQIYDEPRPLHWL
jgi:tRNA 5-methylaminomethyl-2-thiouridine biosynthesis bifunctional protein